MNILKKISKKKLIFDIVTVVVIALFTGAAAYINDYYHAKDVDSYLQSTGQVKVKEIKEGYFFDGKGTEDALIFYPGAKVEYSAYAPLMNQLASEGIDCFLVKMPGNLAIFGSNKAEKIQEKYEYKQWYMAGHSLGGAMAANYTAKHEKQLSGLVLLAAYSTKDISDADFPVVALYGENDKVLNRETFEKDKTNLPKDSVIHEIPGGNHALFGSYGAQDGDGKATISGKEQQKETVDVIIENFL